MYFILLWEYAACISRGIETLIDLVRIALCRWFLSPPFNIFMSVADNQPLGKLHNSVSPPTTEKGKDGYSRVNRTTPVTPFTLPIGGPEKTIWGELGFPPLP